MKKIQLKLTGIMIVLIIMSFVMPLKVLGAQVDLQIIEAENENYIIYVNGLAKTEFDFAISQNSGEIDNDLDYIKSKPDKDGSQKAVITKEQYDGMSEIYLYIKTSEGEVCRGQKINFDEAFKQTTMKEVETTTKRINTKVVVDLEKRDEEVNGVKYKVTVGGLEITDEDAKTSKYYYALPEEGYKELIRLAEEINTKYNDVKTTMYDKIAWAKQFYNEYTTLMEKQEKWNDVNNLTIMQPDTAQKGDQYVVFLKKVDKEEKETIDVKFMTSYREDDEEKIPGRTETKVVKETAKLPITGDSIILFVVLAVIVLVAIILFVRMKKLKNQEENK